MTEIEAYISAMVIFNDVTLEHTQIVISEQFVGDEAVSSEEVERIWKEVRQKVDFIRKISKDVVVKVHTDDCQ